MMKTNITNNAYQSKFLPLIEETETEIKSLILNSALKLTPKHILRDKIKRIIYTLSKKLPKNLKDIEQYIQGLYYFSEREIKKIYDEIAIISALIIACIFASGIAKKKRITPLQALEIVSNKNNQQAIEKTISNKNAQQIIKKAVSSGVNQQEIEKVVPNAKYHAKGSPNVADYEKKIKQKILELGNDNTLVGGKDKKPISIWQKAELDIRHDEQIAKLEEMKASGVKYARLSSHPDCSKRCEPWQGKIVDIQAETSELSGFRMLAKINGETVYCLNDIINQVDKYGYKNNIIVGFNCRHHLHLLNVKDSEFTKEDIEKNRKINAKLRAMERKIRELKQKALLFRQAKDFKNAKIYEEKARLLIEKYKKYAKENNYAWHEYRIKV